MKRWPKKALGELLKIQNGFAFKSELFNKDGRGLPIIRIRDLARGFSETFYDGEHDAAFEVSNGDFLIGMDGEFRCYRWHGGKALLNQRVCRLQSFSRDLNARYVFYGINGHLSEIEDNTAFVTVKHVSSKQIAEIKMPVPPLQEQGRIVQLLDEADELRKLRAQADRRTFALISALFDEMFGDGQSLPTKPLIELVDGNRGISYGVVQRGSHFPGGVPLLRISDFSGNVVDPHELVSVDPSISAQYRRTILTGGELVVSIRGTIGRIAVVPAEAIGWNVAREVAVIPLLPEVSRPFLRAYMLSSFAQNFITNEVRGIAQRGINLEDLRRLPVPSPPLLLQKEFAARASEILELEAEQSASRRRLDDLFNSLLHQAFRGAL